MSQMANVSIVSNKPRMLRETARRVLPLLVALAITDPVWAATLTVSGAPGAPGTLGILTSPFPGVYNFTPPGNGSVGGNAIADTSGTLMDNANTATAYGGNGGNSGNVVMTSPYSYVNGEGGIGGSAAANAPTSPLSGDATSNATAYGGSGGASGFEASGGAGGTASSNARATASGSGSANAHSAAYGGAGGEANYTGNSGAANASASAAASGSGSANASSVAHGDTGYGNGGGANAISSATGSGSGGANSASSDAYGGTGGVGSATAFSAATGGNIADSIALAQGVSGTVLSRSVASNGLGEAAIATASAPTSGLVAARTLAVFGGNQFGGSGSPLGQGYVNVPVESNVIASPTATTVARILGNAYPNVANALGNNTILGAGSMGANNLNGGTQTYTAAANYLYTANGSRAFTLGLLNISAYSCGFDSLSFTVKNGGTTLLSDTFSNLSAAQSFFTDTQHSLGNLNGNVDLSLNYRLTANAVRGAGISYIIGMATPAVPEPGEWLLFLVGLGVLGLKERRRLFCTDKLVSV